MFRAGTLIIALSISGTAVAAGAQKGHGDPYAGEISAAKRSIAETLKDPDSVQFRGLKAVKSKHGLLVCGQFNAKNSYGGYVGYETFVYASGRLFTQSEAGPDYADLAIACFI